MVAEFGFRCCPIVVLCYHREEIRNLFLPTIAYYYEYLVVVYRPFPYFSSEHPPHTTLLCTRLKKRKFARLKKIYMAGLFASTSGKARRACRRDNMSQSRSGHLVARPPAYSALIPLLRV
eukprot:TRINITY_DN3238_c0_g1_i1.p1 TRINITY_DN3238_c0_g1~~TRINITY_DN3238_c0_g1_i1.p1  ORF type:complete len:120 (+),score=38.63 TRINITY_DN3238_c0_g1_i1:173-532(+)